MIGHLDPAALDAFATGREVGVAEGRGQREAAQRVVEAALAWRASVLAYPVGPLVGRMDEFLERDKVLHSKMVDAIDILARLRGAH